MAAVETRQHGPSIDKLLDFFVANDGTAYYQVKWKPTWERADALLQFNDLVDSFWKFVNGAHAGNLYNNQSLKNRPDPVVPPNIPQETYQQLPNNNVQPVQQAAQRPPILRQTSNPHISQQNLQSIPQPQDCSKMHSLSSTSNVGNSLQQQRPPAAFKNSTFAENHPSTVIIDSDEDDNLSELPNLGIVSPTQNVPGNFNPTHLSGEMQQQQLEQYMPPMWNMTPKIEPSEMIDQKPFQGNQQQQFQFPMQNFNNNGGSINIKPRGSGRGRGGTAGAKRKQGMPPSVSPNKQPKPPVVKMETSDDMDVFADEKPIIDGTGANWKDYFETLESFVDGQKVSASYKCKVCGSTIAQLSNCNRHFKKHVTDGSGEHECPVCGKKFYRIDYIERHLKQHGQGSSEEVQKMVKLIAAGMKKK